MEGLRDEVAHGRQDVEEDPSLVAARADVDVSHINLLRTGASEHELGGVRRRLEESLEVKASNTVDRLSPAACRRRPATPDESSNHRRDVDQRQADSSTSVIEGPPDLLLVGVTVLAVVLLTSPTMVAGLVSGTVSSQRLVTQ